MSKLIEEVLQTWREGERLLEALPPLDPDHETVALAVTQLREAYHRLTAKEAAAEDSLAKALETIERAEATIERAMMRLAANQGNGPAPATG